MAQLDRFLDVLIQRDARELRLASGEPAALVFADNVKLRLSYRHAVIFDDAPRLF